MKKIYRDLKKRGYEINENVAETAWCKKKYNDDIDLVIVFGLLDIDFFVDTKGEFRTEEEIKTLKIAYNNLMKDKQFVEETICSLRKN